MSIRYGLTTHGMLDREPKTYDVGLSHDFAKLHFGQILACAQYRAPVFRRSFRIRPEGLDADALAIQQRLAPSDCGGPCACDDATFACGIRYFFCGTPLLIFAHLAASIPQSNIAYLIVRLRWGQTPSRTDDIFSVLAFLVSCLAGISANSTWQSKTIDQASFLQKAYRIPCILFCRHASIGYAS